MSHKNKQQMETFLKQVAIDLYKKTGGDLSHTAVVFPNKRAALFFNEYLAQEAGHPIWSPAYVSISELFRQCSSLQIGDPVKLVCELYKIFRNATGSQESLDAFYYWGELLISDFDDADKNMADTKTLFSNLSELNELTDHEEFLEEGQKEALSQFFRNFSIEQSTELKDRFSRLWSQLGNIYREFRDVLHRQGLAYEGMLYREVIEQLDVTTLPHQHYVFVGFNVLNKVEHTLFTRLHEAGMASFYWDYDEFYLQKHPHEAGEFIRRNLRDFPSELPPEHFRNLNSPKEITYVESSTENAQIRYLPQWLGENLTEQEKETAVVLCNEALLPSMLHALPGEVRHVNITMGFPMSQTPAYSFLNALLQLHTEGYNPNNGRFLFAEVVSLLKHPYTRMLSEQADELARKLTTDNRFFPHPSELQQDEVLRLLFTPRTQNAALCQLVSDALKQVALVYKNKPKEKDNEAFDQLYREALFKAYTQINRFHSLIESGELDVTPQTFVRLVNRVMSSSSIPFHGEPAIGLQVMGVLETRNLDFRHLILLSVNEGQLPKAGGDTSFIPYNLRKAFGMTTIDHKIAVFAYYFYRLLQRAEKVSLVYNTTSDGLNRGEMSRFMLQFLIEWGYDIKRVKLEAAQSPQGSEEILIRKTPEIMKRLQSIYDQRVNPRALISPSALNCYMDCSLKFYYKYVAGLTAPEEVSAEIDSALFGTIFHDAAEHIYKDLTARNGVITRQLLTDLLSKEQEHTLREYIDRGFREHFFNLPENERPEYNGIQYINSEVIYRYIRQLLEKDLQYAPFSLVGSEVKVRENIRIATPKGEIHSCIGGTIDRMDLKENCLRIVDYKTGGKSGSTTSVEALFEPSKNRSGYIFQTFLYAAILCEQSEEKFKDKDITPVLLYIHEAANEDYSPVIKMGEARKKEEVTDFRKFNTDFRTHLKTLLEEIFNPDGDFRQTEIEEKCAYCDFKNLCKK